MITNKLKETVSNSTSLLPLTLTITLLEKCLKTLIEKGISNETMSFLVLGFEKIIKEFEEAGDIFKNNEEFKTIIKDIEKEFKNE